MNGARSIARPVSQTIESPETVRSNPQARKKAIAGTYAGLTTLGRTLLEPVRALAAWALKHRERIQTARDRFDTAATKTERAPGRARVAAAVVELPDEL